MTEAKEARKAIVKVLKEQQEKGIKRWQVALSLFFSGFSENQVGKVMGIDNRTAHSYKVDFKNNKARREIKNYLRLDVIGRQGFIKNCKVLVGNPFNPIAKNGG